MGGRPSSTRAASQLRPTVASDCGGSFERGCYAVASWVGEPIRATCHVALLVQRGARRRSAAAQGHADERRRLRAAGRNWTGRQRQGVRSLRAPAPASRLGWRCMHAGLHPDGAALRWLPLSRVRTAPPARCIGRYVNLPTRWWPSRCSTWSDKTPASWCVPPARSARSHVPPAGGSGASPVLGEPFGALEPQLRLVAQRRCAYARSARLHAGRCAASAAQSRVPRAGGVAGGDSQRGANDEPAQPPEPGVLLLLLCAWPGACARRTMWAVLHVRSLKTLVATGACRTCTSSCPTFQAARC